MTVDAITTLRKADCTEDFNEEEESSSEIFSLDDHDHSLHVEANKDASSRKHEPKSPEPDSFVIESKKVLSGVKWSVIGSLMVAGAAVATSTYLFTKAQEQTRFEERFQDDAERIVNAYNHQTAGMIWAALSVYASLISTENYNSDVHWPNVTLPEFDLHTLGHLQTAGLESMFWAPILNAPQQVRAWSAYAVQHQKLAGINGTQSTTLHNRSIADGIFRLDANQRAIDDNSTTLTIPIWQASPYKAKRHLQMLNLFSIGQLRNPLSLAMTTRTPFVSSFLDDDVASFFKGSANPAAKSIFVFPVMNTRAGTRTTGMIVSEIDWVASLSLVFAKGPAIVVLKNTCQQQRSFRLKDGTVAYVGEGDIHDEKYNHMKWSTNVTSFRRYWNANQRPDTPTTIYPTQEAAIKLAENETRLNELGICVYFMDIYPTTEYEDKYNTVVPGTYVLIIVSVFVGVGLLFVVYDILVERRQHRAVESAAKSNALIRSLFPATFRDRLLQNSTGSSHAKGRAGYLKRPTQTGNGVPVCLLSTNSDFVCSPSPKLRLTNFLTNSTNKTLDSTCTSNLGDDPIAELFSNTTVIFADIAGFTAWSSEREPSQVFKLLETLYASFDAIAKRLDVFKVETIGDCYVAVAGLPQPNPQHAIVCARFAYQCLAAMKRLTHHLELTLGPGTSELALRIGLHSGPVTAGVLRGEKSRFQLFGDTMNTARRMESTGDAGKIQVSEVTASLLEAGGKGYWLTKRQETIAVKGKGDMQTWWVKLPRARNRTSATMHALPSRSQTIGSVEDIPSEGCFDFDPENSSSSRRRFDFEMRDATFAWESLTSHPSGRLDNAMADRLVDWNVEVLMGFLEKVVQNRLQTASEPKMSTKAPTRSGLLVIDEVVEVIDLPDFGTVSNGNERISRRLSRELPTAVRAQLREFVSAIARRYRDVPFHNFEHASHVTMSANKLMKRIITPDDHVAASEKPLRPLELHRSTFGISSDPLTQFAVVFAALIHDIDHTGLSNSTLIEREFPVAHTFNNKSVAEQNSVVVAWDLLMEPRFADLQKCIFPHESDRSQFRQLIINAVMATDIMDRDMLLLRKKRWSKAFDSTVSHGSVDEEKLDVNRKATIVIEHIIQASDVAHTMQHWHVYLKWNARLYKELYQSYRKGYISKDPSEGWYEGEIGFFDFYVIPLAKKLKECGVFGVSGDEYLQYAEWNRQEWEQKGLDETRKMVMNRDEDCDDDELQQTE